MIKWEYMVVLVENNWIRMVNHKDIRNTEYVDIEHVTHMREVQVSFLDFLAQVGLEGWEIAGTPTFSGQTFWYIILKRPIS